jgi:hypothetical protein
VLFGKRLRKDLMAITKIFKTELKELPEEMATEAEDVEGEVTPRKRLSGQRSQAMGAASKRFSRGVALRFLVDAKNKGFPMTVHLATQLLVDLFSGYGRSGISEAVLVALAGGGPDARRNRKLNLAECRTRIIDSGTLAAHRVILKKSKIEAEVIRLSVAAKVK